MNEGKGMIREGAALLWRRQKVLWWLFGANLAVGLVASYPVRAQLGSLDRSLYASASLYHQMNLAAIAEVLTRPEFAPTALFSGSVLPVLCYVLILLFAIGGVLETLYTDRTPRFGEFLRVSAGYFWRMVRLAIIFALLMLPLLAAQSGVGPLRSWIGNHSDSEQLAFWVRLAILVALGLIALAVRVWVDIAQLDCVVHERAAVRRSLGHARRLLGGNFWRVYGSVLAIHLLLAAVTAVLLLLWLRLPHEAVGATFVLGELIVLFWIGARLWQKTAETAWFHQRDAQEPMLEISNQLSAVSSQQ